LIDSLKVGGFKISDFYAWFLYDLLLKVDPKDVV